MKSYVFLIAKIILLSMPLGCGTNSLPETPKPPGEKPENLPKTPPFCAQKSQSEIYNCLKDQIASHKPEPLSYIDLLSLINESLITKEEAIKLIIYGYNEAGFGNPLLFLKASESVAPKEYSLNFLWIHKNLLSEPGHIMGSDDQQLNKHVISPLKDWQSKQPEAYINFWFDGHLVNSTHVQKTRDLLQTSGLDLKQIRLRDIRDIPSVNQESRLFDTDIPIYFRVDLAKALIADHVLRNDKLPFVVNADSNVVAIVRSQLFDYPTLMALKNIGYSFGTADMAEQENSFIMLHNSPTIKTLERHTNMLDQAVSKAKMKNYKIDPQDAFSEYRNFKKEMRVLFRNKTGKTWPSQDIQENGKPMIFPKSQFGIGGYSEKDVEFLRKALMNASQQKDALVWPEENK
jgi:hypothetical protein